MTKESWSAKLKREKRELEEEVLKLKDDLTNKDGLVSKKTSIVIGVVAFILGAILL